MAMGIYNLDPGFFSKPDTDPLIRIQKPVQKRAEITIIILMSKLDSIENIPETEAKVRNN